jgi:phosphoglycerol transferase
MTAGPLTRHRPTTASPAHASDRAGVPEWLFVVLTAAASLVALVPVLRLWDMRLDVPFAYGADATFNLMIVRNLLDGGWVDTNASLGAPFGQELYDFPTGADNLNLLALKILAAVTRDPAVAMNLFFLLTFPVVAVAAVLVLRRLGLSRPAAFACALLFAFAPYHFWRGEVHVFLSSYVAVPLGALLTLRTIEGELLFSRKEEGRLRWLSRRSLGTFALCAVIASTGLYYAFFTAVLVTIAAVVTAATRRRGAILLSGLAATAAIGAVVVVNVAPSLVHSAANGANEEPVVRSADESERFGLKLMQLLLPVDGHRLEPLARRAQLYEENTTTPANAIESGQTLGLVGDVGFIALLFAALAGAVAGARWQPPALLRNASLPTLVALLFGITTGFATLFAYAVTPKFHAPGRISIVIAFFSLLAVGVLLDAAVRRWAGPSRSGLVAPLAAAAIVVLGIADQTTSAFVPRWDEAAAEWHADEAYAREARATLPEGASVFQLPYAAFPDNDAPGRSLDYDGARAYIHGAGLRWSYGAMKGRPEDWAAALATAPAAMAATAAAAAGFDALELDRWAYAEEPPDTGGLGRALVTSDGGRYVLVDLRQLRAQLVAEHGRDTVDAAGAAALHPVRLSHGEGFDEVQRGDDPRSRASAARTVRLVLDNPSSGPRRVVLATELASGDAGAHEVAFSFPDGSATRAGAGRGPAAVRRELKLPPGRSEIVATVRDGGAVRWTGTVVADPVLLGLVGR